jgi:uncharacterized membrane protein (Fun14 family)
MDSILLGTIAPYAGTLVSGGVFGLACGYFFKKLLKVILFIGGAIIALLSILAWQKIAVIDWAVLQHKSNEVAIQAVNGVSSALNNTNAQMNHVGLGVDILYPVFGVTAFLPGFALGLKWG